jgi:hypothetical protein
MRSRLVIKDVSIHSKGESGRWVMLPAKPQIDRAGKQLRDARIGTDGDDLLVIYPPKLSREAHHFFAASLAIAM